MKKCNEMKAVARMLVMGTTGIACLFQSGCLAFKSTDMEWRNARNSPEDQPLEMADAMSSIVTPTKYEIDSGRRWSVGLLPGFGAVFDEGKTECKHKINLGSSGKNDNGAGLLLLCAVLPVVGTFSSMLVSPFGVETEWSLIGLMGCCHWHVNEKSGSLVVLKNGEAENVIERKFDAAEVLNTNNIGGTFEGVKYFVEYPGFQSIQSGVELCGAVDVVFRKNGELCARRFKKSTLVPAGLAYEDAALTEKDERHVKYSQYEQHKEESKKAAEREAARRVEDSLKKISEMFARGEFEGAKELCVKQVNEQFACDERFREWQKKCEQAIVRREKEKEDCRVADKLKRIRGFIEQKSFQQALDECNGESGAQFDDLREVATKGVKAIKLDEKVKRLEVLVAKEEFEAALKERQPDETDARLVALYKNAEESLRKTFSADVAKAEAGDAEASYRVGEAYRIGNAIVERDTKLARKFLRQAYDNGCEKAWEALEKLH